MATTAKRTVDSVLAGSKIIAMEELISLLEPNAAQLTTMILKTGKKSVPNTKFSHREQELRPRIITVVATYSADASTVYVSGTGSTYQIGTDASYVNIRDTIYNTRTKELMLITAINTATGALSVTPDRAGTANGAGVVGDELYIVGDTFGEDADAPLSIMTTEVQKDFYTQIFRDTCTVTKSATATNMYHGNDRLWQQKIKMIEHKIKLELSLLLGGTGASALETIGGTADGGYSRYTASLMGWIKTNEVKVAGNFTPSQLWSGAKKCAKYHYGDFLFYGSPTAIGAISGWGIPGIQMSPASKTYGLDLNMIISPFGNIHLAQGRLLVGEILSGYSFLLPMPIEDFIKFRVLSANGENRDTRLMLDIKKDNDPDYYKDQVKTEGGWELWEEKKMCLFTGING